jgi:hypothetical protein
MSMKAARITKPKRDRTNENFSKRLQIVFGKCDNVVTDYNAEVYLLIQRGKLWEYVASNCRGWPLSSKEIVSYSSQ